jgi:hypothetical protein
MPLRKKIWRTCNIHSNVFIEDSKKHFVRESFRNDSINEPLGAKGLPLVGEEVRKDDVGKVGS